MAINCVNISLPEVKALAVKYNLPTPTIAAKIALWQDRNGLDKWPTEGELGLEVTPLQSVTTDTKYLQDKLGMAPHQISVVKGLLNDGSFGALMQDGNILLSSLANRGVEYHEAFHRVFNLFLPKDEQLALISEFKDRDGYNSLLEPYRKLYPELSEDGLIEEYISDEFADFVLSEGKYATAPQRLNFFQRVWKFFKDLFTNGKPNESAIQDLFERINKGDFASAKMVNPYVSKIKNSRKFRDVSSTTMTHLLEGLNNRILGKFVSSNNGRFGLEAYSDVLSFELAFDDSLDDISGYLEDKYHAQGTSEETKRGIAVIAGLINDEPNVLKKLYEEYLKELKIKLKFSTDTVQTEDEAKNDPDAPESTVKDYAFLKPSIELDALDKTSNSVKLLLASITKKQMVGNSLVEVKNPLGLPTSVDFSEMFKYLVNNLSDLPFNTQAVLTKLQALSVDKPELKDIITLLGGVTMPVVEYGDSDINIYKGNAHIIRTEFVQAFTNHNNSDFIAQYNTDGSVVTFDGGVQDTIERLLTDWEVGFLNKIDTPEKITNFREGLKVILNIKDPIQQAARLKNYFGMGNIPISKNEIIVNKFEGTRLTLGSILTRWANDIISKTYTDEQLREIFKKKPLNTTSPLWFYKDAVAIARRVSDKEVNTSSLNINNKRIYRAIQHTYLTTAATYLNNSANPEVDLPWIYDSWNEGSVILDKISRGSKLKVNTIGGYSFKETSDNIETSSLSDTEYASMLINDTLQGIYHFPQAGSRQVVNVASIVTPEGMSELLVNFTTLDDPALVDVFAKYLADDIIAAKSVQELPSKFKSGINESIFFEFINGPTFDKIKRMELGSRELVDHLKTNYSDSIVREIKDYVAKEKAYYDTLGLFKSIYKKINNVETLVGFSGLTKTTPFTDEAPKETLLNQAIINALVFNIETFKVWYGHPKGFGTPDNISKRLSSFNSSKKASITSTETSEWLNHRNAVDIYYRTGTGYKATDNIVFTEALMEAGKQSVRQEYVDKIVNTYRNIYQKRGLAPAAMAAKLKLIRDSWSNAEESDGLSLINIYAFRELKDKAGTWSIEHEKVFRKLISGKSISPEETVFFMEKPLYVGDVFKDSLDSYISVPREGRVRTLGIRKTAYMPLLPNLLGETNLQKISDKMIREGVDVMHMTSTAKQGDININNLYDEQGAINLGSWKTNELLWQYMGIQQDSATHLKDEVSEATQSAKIQGANMYDNGVPLDVERGNLVILKDNIVNEIGLREIEDLEFKFGVIKTPDGKMVISKWEELFKLVREELTRNTAPDNTYESLERLEASAKSGIPMKIDGLQSATKIEEVLLAVVHNRVIKRKRNGTMLPQTSIQGLEIGKRELQNGRLVLSEELKFYEWTLDSEGNVTSISPAEVVVPLPQELVPYVESLQGNTFEERLEKYNSMVDKGKAPKVIIKGLRIPNQNYASNDVFEVKRFSHPITGAVIVPSATVIKVGSDFDIDKVTIYYPNVDLSSGKLVPIPFYTTKVTDQKGRLKRYQYYLNDNGAIDRLIRSRDRNINREIRGKVNEKLAELLDSQVYGAIRDEQSKGNISKQVFDRLQEEIGRYTEYNSDKLEYIKIFFTQRADELSPEGVTLKEGLRDFATLNAYRRIADEAVATIGDIEEYQAELEKEAIDSSIFTQEDLEEIANKEGLLLFQEFIKLSPFKQNSKRGLENAYLDVEQKLLLHPNNFEQLMAAISPDELKSKAMDIKRAEGVKDDNISFKDMLSSSANITKFSELFAALMGVGQTAPHITSSALFQKAGVRLNPVVSKMWLISPEISNDYRVGHVYDTDKLLISESMSNFLTAFVDAEKDNYSIYLGLKTEVNNVALYLLRRRIPVEVIGLLLRQPIVKDYLRAKVINKANERFGAKYLSTQKLIESVMNKYGGSIANMYFSTGTTILPSASEQFVYLTKDILSLNLTAPNQKIQQQVLDNFLMYIDQSSKFQDGVRATQPDTSRDKDLNQVKRWMELWDTVKKGYAYNVITKEGKKTLQYRFFENIEEVFSAGSYQYPFYKARMAKYQYFNTLKLVEAAEIKQRLDAFKQLLTAYKTTEQASSITSTIDGDFLLYALSKTNAVDYTLINSLLKSNSNSVAKRIAEIQNTPSHPLHTNSAIAVLRPQINNKGVDNLRINQKLTVRDINNLEEGMLKIQKVDPILYNDIMLLSLFQAGVKNSPFQLIKMLPEGLVYDVIGKQVQTISNPSNVRMLADNFEEFVVLFYRNNPQLAPKKSNYRSTYREWNREDKKFNVVINNKFYTSIGNERIKNYSIDLATVKTIDELPIPDNAPTNMEISFIEDSSTGYADRTKRNASADATIAIAVDFNSAGEKLTKKTVNAQKKKYIPIDANSLEVTQERVDKIVDTLNSINQNVNFYDETINIYAGSNQNTELSNFAIRPFTVNVETLSGEKQYTFQSVEQGFHFHKALVANNPQVAKQILATTNGGQLKRLTNRSNLKMTPEQVKEWDDTSKSIMLNLMYDSYAQNPKAAEKLLATGNAKITHEGPYKPDRWTKDFPDVVMTVRDMLKEEEFGQEWINTNKLNNKSFGISLNIAGNGIYTMKGKYTQEQVDDFTYQLLKAIVESPILKTKIESIRTGGQTGFDEAGAKAGIKLGIPTTILAPKGWKFRNINGVDISNEQQFKSRFSIGESTTTQSKESIPQGNVISTISETPSGMEPGAERVNAEQLNGVGITDLNINTFDRAFPNYAYWSKEEKQIKIDAIKSGEVTISCKIA